MPVILHVSQPTEAGVANVALGLVADQVSRGWDVHLACPLDGPLPALAAQRGARVHPWPATRSPGPGVIDETRRLTGILAHVQPDLVHLHSSKAGLAGRLALRGRVPTVFQPHAWSFEAVDGLTGKASKAWERIAASWTTLTLCVSEAEHRLGRQTRVLGKHSVVIPNGVDTQQWTPRDRHAARLALGLETHAPVVVCVGRLARQKGQDVLLQAWPRVRARHTDATLHIVGDGPDHASLTRLLTPGAFLHEAGDPAPWFGASDVVVVPSRWEGMPLVILEAMSAGRPVVATSVNGVREALGRTDLVPTEDVVSLADAIDAFLAHPDHARKAGLDNRQRVVRHFDTNASASATAEAYLSLLRDSV